jgi:excisionase family DNA binding protein
MPDSNVINSPLLTLHEVCALCRVSLSTGRRWVRRGFLRPVVLPQHNLRFRQADVDAFIDQQRDATKE